MAMNCFTANPDRFTSLRDIADALVETGLRRCCLIFGIDYTKSNRVQGEKTFEGKSLHEISDDCDNPYQEVICILGETLQPLDEDGLIPAFGFGGDADMNQSFFSLKKGGSCVGFREVLSTYRDITPDVKLSRPTNFGPLIRKAIAIVKATKKASTPSQVTLGIPKFPKTDLVDGDQIETNFLQRYHILVIAADGQVNEEEETINEIIEASNYPLSIICIGVGDGPWGVMKEFDDRIKGRLFDNFQFFSFHEVVSEARNRQTSFALHALMEIPDQYHAIQELGLLDKLQQE